MHKQWGVVTSVESNMLCFECRLTTYLCCVSNNPVEVRIIHTSWLIHIDFFSEVTIKKHIIDIQLPNASLMM